MAKENAPFFLAQDELVDLVRRLQAQETTAEGIVYDIFKDKIYGHIYKLTEGSKDVTEALLPEVFTEIFHKVHSLREPLAFVAWTNKIVEHQVAAYYRKYRRELRALDKYAKEEAELEIQADIESLITKDMLQSIPDKQARAIHAHIIKGIPIKDIALFEGVPVGTIKSRLFYGKKALKKILEEKAKIF